LVTSSSADGTRRPGAAATVAAAAALYVAILGVAVVLAVVVPGDGWLPVLVFASAAVATITVTALLVLPRLRALQRATAAANDLAALAFDTRIGADAEFAGLASALNAAAARIGALVATLRQQRAQLEALLNASSDATVAIDPHGGVTYMNDAAARLFSSAGAVGRPFIEAVRDHDLNDLIVAAAARGERSVRFVPYGPQQRWLQATAVPIEGAGDWAALAIFHDLTEVRRLDAVRRDFISNVSHELRTPLAGIRAAAETLHEGAIDDRDAAAEFIGHIQREVDRMTQMVEELLELSRIESGAAPMSFAPVDAGALVAATVARFAQQAERAGLRLVAEKPDGPLEVIGDGERLERALSNLVANAIRFTESGGAVTVAAAEDDGAVALVVRDTGIGIEPWLQARVFERFYKADRGRGETGTGLGLAIVKHIALAHGGTAHVESRPGRGSTFTIRLPRR
jgi:two-component system phosphate regulon sensor histidine kinase PhoR